jgi:hypothetical protein
MRLSLESPTKRERAPSFAYKFIRSLTIQLLGGERPYHLRPRRSSLN